MKTVGFVLMIIVTILMFGGVNYYIGLRGWQGVGSLIPFINAKIYWILFSIIAVSFILARLGEKFLPNSVEGYLNLVGAYWMAAMLYFLIILPLVDIGRFIGGKASFIPQGIRENTFIKTYAGLFVFLIVIGILIYGTYNAKNIKVSQYDINVAKKAGNVRELRIAMFSDAHLGSIVDNARLTKMIDKVNELNPDIVLMPGDIVDEKLSPFVKQNMGENFKRLKSEYGVYFSTGNHEYYGGEVEGIVNNLKASGVKVLSDDCVKIDDSFYIAGRQDIASLSYNKKERKTLDQILNGVDKSLPIILMDHNPKNLEEPQKAGVDLQVSGHTHRGQMFPSEYITRRLYEIDYGYLKKDNFNIVVTSGIGTWGPPIRVGNSSELDLIVLHFKE
ncbi:metallophosphoesterase [Clostridium sp. YIM B02515]|uniref:Metallophosphoesterase n=1 Tax=Clostridium rhizosphaerae TaxID=2803861 RepID=A0ABS1TD05_9CLOT|nr:metallophosphoesterase [Clostridium rhizosphaerae]MBL4937230.1 metallophosphoesterase [Clostridium rhizosphaerae]